MIYTSVTGNYDKPRTDVKCFTEYDRFKDQRLNAKIYKCLPHLFMPKEKWWLWIDGNLTLVKDSFMEFLEFTTSEDVVVFENPYRGTVGEEMEEIVRLGLDKKEIVEAQTYNKKAKLPACFLIFRKNTAEVIRSNEQWWAEICAGSVRDQISFPKCYRDAKYLPRVNPFNNKYFTRHGHSIPRG
ncbi:MAG: DUF616 domain-containing protein [Candidatus Scalindua sp.]|jgi:hypothetical protein|nr:DUF616 domain-containing protein [Candidatus Scalindua sp.]